VRVGILGPLEVERDGRAIEVSGGRLRALLARLALEGGRPVTASRLVDAVWEEELPADHVHALQSLVSRLRRSLGAGAIEPAPGGYRLAVDHVDAHRFEQLAAAGASALRAGDHVRAATQLTEALAVWRGPALADLTAYGFAAAAATRLEDARLTAVADRAEADLALGRGAEHAAELEALAAEHPLHERIAAGLVGALAAAGRQADALDAYERIRARLADELGAAPSPALAAAHLAVLRGETVTEAPAPARRSNLRAPVTSFVGREEELARIGSLLETSRLVTLVGPGGAGKTRLAQETAGARADHTPDGVWMVELAPVTADVEVVPAVLTALGVRNADLLERSTSPRPREGLDRLLDVLGDRDAILVLDNCEHLIAAAAELADRLLGHCPRLRILATSREPLAIAGESLAPVPPLPLPASGATAAEALAHPAIELFADRAAAARPGFVIDDETVGVCVEICRRLDGLPLAIELAAARLRSMPVQTLAARLDDRFRLLTGGSRTALPRHRTLRAVVDWSWDLLEEPERRLARRLAVLSGGATEASAAALAGDGEDVLDGLTALADRSLLQPLTGADTPRYRMLETIREYGLEKLADAGELEATRTRHARHFAALAAEAEPHLRGPGQPLWLRRLEAERDDLVSALRWLGDSGDAARALRMARDLLWFWLLSGSPSEAQAWSAFALEVPGEADPHDRLIAEGIQAAASAAGGDHGVGNDELDAVAARLEEIGDGGVPLLAIARPILAFFAGDHERTDRMLAETLEHPDPWVRASTLLLRAQHAENAGDQIHNRSDLDLAAAAFRDVGDAWGLAMVLASQANAWMMAGDLDQAETALDEAFELVEHINGSAGTGMLSIQVADIRLRRGDLDGARAAALRALDTSDLGTDGSIFVTSTLARIAAIEGDHDEVRLRIDEAEARLERMGPQRPEQGHARVFVEVMRARLATDTGDHEAAAAALAAGYAAAVGTTDMPVVAAVGVAAAIAASAADRHEEAAELLGAATALRGAADDTNPDVAQVTATLRAALGDDGFDAAYGRGRALDRDAAFARLDPAGSGAAPVRP
jgi:predicted ATPase/DNA-binding SARP family transcriptional activator